MSTTTDTAATTTAADTTTTTAADTSKATTTAADTAKAADTSKAADTAATTTATAATDPAKAAAPKWPENWREQMVGDLAETATAEEKESHEKMLKLVKRYNTPSEVAKALREANRKISSGELKAPLPKDATKEQLAEWRKENGIPETPDKYDLGLPDGTVLGDSDKAVVDAWVAKVHGANASPDVVKAGTAAYLEIREQQAQAIADANEEAKNDVAATLGAEWGADYKKNVAGIQSLLSQAGSSVADAVMNARGADGIALMNKPEVVKWFAAHARELGYVGATVVPAGGDLGKSIDDEIAAIKKEQFLDNGQRNPAYWKDEKKQARYRDLLQAQERRAKA